MIAMIGHSWWAVRMRVHLVESMSMELVCYRHHIQILPNCSACQNPLVTITAGLYSGLLFINFVSHRTITHT